jgi:hypothetical protein
MEDRMDFRGTPPEGRAGDASPNTAALRPRIGMDHNRCEIARRMKREDPDLTPGQIAARLGGDASELSVALALATLRCRNPGRTRATVNLTLEGAAFVKAERHEGERIWEVGDRLFGELRRLRAAVADASGRRG